MRLRRATRQGFSLWSPFGCPIVILLDLKYTLA
jgi:hypothetical protein